MKAARIRLLFFFGLYVKKIRTRNLTYISIEDRRACAYLKPRNKQGGNKLCFGKKKTNRS